MRASSAPLVNGVLLYAFSFWLGECRSANNDFFDSVSVDSSPWQPITNNRDSQRPSSPKFPPIRYANPNHASSNAPQWHTNFNRGSTTEKFKDGDRVGPNNKPKFPPLSVDGYKSYSPGPFFNPNKPDFFESQPPFNPFADDFRPLPESNKRVPNHGIKPPKESPAPVYKDPGEPPILLGKPKPTTPSSFDFPAELNNGPAPFPGPQHSHPDSRKKVKLPASSGIGTGFQNDKLNSLKTSGRYPPLEDDRNIVRDTPVNGTGAWKEHAHEVQIGHGNKNRGQLKFHQNGVSIREVSPAEAPISETNISKNPNLKPGSSQKNSQNRTVATSTSFVNNAGTNAANELKPDFNKQAHVMYSNTAQLADDAPPTGLSDNEEFRLKDFVPGNVIRQVTSIRNRESTTKPSLINPVKSNNPDLLKSKLQVHSENGTDNVQPQNELANTVPILESTPNSYEKVREPVSVSEETTSSETKKKFPFRRPQLLSTSSTEKPTTFEPSRRPTLKPSLKNRINLNQASKFRSTTELPTTTTPAYVTEPPIRVKNHNEDGAVQSNDIPLKPSIRPVSDNNSRRRPTNRPNQSELNIPPTGWALASFKNFTASRSTRRPATEPPIVGVTEVPAKIKPFVAWSTRLQKMTTTESTATDMTTLMDDSDVEMTTFAVEPMKNTIVTSSTPNNLNNSKDFSNSSKINDNMLSVNGTSSNTTASSSEETNKIVTIEKNGNKIITLDSNPNDNESIEDDATSPDGGEGMTENVINFESEGSTSESELNTANAEKDIITEEKVGMNNDINAKNSTSPSEFLLKPQINNEVSSSTKDVKTDLAQDSITDIKDSPVNDDASKPTESLMIPSENDEIEFVEATNNSNAHGLDDNNDLKTKPVETIYLTDVKPGVVELTNSVGQVFQPGKDGDILTVANSSGLNNLVNSTKNDTHFTLSFSDVPLFTSTDSVPFSKNYQNNSSQYSNELNTGNEFGVQKGVSSQLDFKTGGNKSHPDSATDIFNRIKDFNEYPTEGMFKVSFDLPVDNSQSTEGNKFITNIKNFTKTISQFSSTASSIPNISNEEIPDFEFSSYKPYFSTDFIENTSDSSVSKKPTTESEVKAGEVEKASSVHDSETETKHNKVKQLSTQTGDESGSKIFNTTVSIENVSPETETTVKSVEKISLSDGENKDTETTSEAVDLSTRSSGNETVTNGSWTEGPTKSSTSHTFNRFDYMTTSTSAAPRTTESSTIKAVTSTRKHENFIPLVPDKYDEMGGTDEDVYIETDVEQDSTSTVPSKTVVTTAKAPSSNMSLEVSETDLCPSTSQCPVPLHIQLHVETSQSQICKTKNKLEKSIIKLFKSGTERVQSPEQIKFINFNFNDCTKDDTEKMSDINLYVSDVNGDFEQSINEEFIELYRKMGLSDYEPKVESAHLVMNKGNGGEVSVGSDMDHSKTRVIAAVVIICLALICFILVILLLMIIRKRQKRFNYGQRCVPVTLDDYSLDNISVYNSVRRKGDARASKRSYGNPAFDDPKGPTHRMNFAGLANFTSDQNAIDEEFASIPVIAVKADELPPSAETKNRYANVIPLPETRVHLISTKHGGSSDYINANYVQGPKKAEKFYIACQAPLQSTIEDFWRMIWEQQSKVILMLTDFFENGVEKCANYLPPSEVIDCNRVFGDFQVTLKKRENREKYIISSLQLKNLETNSWREVTHLWYTSWPSLGVPNEESSIIAFLIEARVYMKNNTGPNIVHCSPGTGRTGTVIACDLCIRDFEVTRMVDVPKCVYMLRRCRAGAVQTKQQYAFIYKVLNLYAAKLTGGGLDSI